MVSTERCPCAAIALDVMLDSCGMRRKKTSIGWRRCWRSYAGYPSCGSESGAISREDPGPASLSIPVSRANLRWVRYRDVTDKQCEAFFGNGMADELPAIRGVLQPYPVNIDRPDVGGDPS